MNATTNEICQIDFLRGGWSNKTKSAIVATVMDSDGKFVWELSGKYTEKIVATNLITKENWTVFERPS